MQSLVSAEINKLKFAQQCHPALQSCSFLPISMQIADNSHVSIASQSALDKIMLPSIMNIHDRRDPITSKITHLPCGSEWEKQIIFHSNALSLAPHWPRESASDFRICMHASMNALYAELHVINLLFNMHYAMCARRNAEPLTHKASSAWLKIECT
jgi:hypothetical protein